MLRNCNNEDDHRCDRNYELKHITRKSIAQQFMQLFIDPKIKMRGYNNL